MKIGISGHQNLDNKSDWDWVKLQIDKIILTDLHSPLTGISSLAIGADQIFAKSILEHRGKLIAIIPFPEYQETFLNPTDKELYFSILKVAKPVVLEKKGSSEQSFFEAGKKVVEMSDLMIAVWDGKPAEGLGGTADIVRYVKQINKRLIHINPINRTVV